MKKEKSTNLLIDIVLMSILPILGGLWQYLNSEGFYNLMAAWIVIMFLCTLLVIGVYIATYVHLMKDSTSKEAMAKILDETIKARDNFNRRFAAGVVYRLVAATIIVLLFWGGKFVIGSLLLFSVLSMMYMEFTIRKAAEGWEEEKLTIDALEATRQHYANEDYQARLKKISDDLSKF